MKKLAALVVGLIIMSILAVGGLACGKSDNKSAEVPKQVYVEVTNDEFQTASASTGGRVSKAIDVPSGGSLVVTL